MALRDDLYPNIPESLNTGLNAGLRVSAYVRGRRQAATQRKDQREALQFYRGEIARAKTPEDRETVFTNAFLDARLDDATRELYGRYLGSSGSSSSSGKGVVNFDTAADTPAPTETITEQNETDGKGGNKNILTTVRPTVPAPGQQRPGPVQTVADVPPATGSLPATVGGQLALRGIGRVPALSRLTRNLFNIGGQEEPTPPLVTPSQVPVSQATPAGTTNPAVAPVAPAPVAPVPVAPAPVAPVYDRFVSDRKQFLPESIPTAGVAPPLDDRFVSDRKQAFDGQPLPPEVPVQPRPIVSDRRQAFDDVPVAPVAAPVAAPDPRFVQPQQGPLPPAVTAPLPVDPAIPSITNPPLRTTEVPQVPAPFSDQRAFDNATLPVQTAPLPDPAVAPAPAVIEAEQRQTRVTNFLQTLTDQVGDIGDRVSAAGAVVDDARGAVRQGINTGVSTAVDRTRAALENLTGRPTTTTGAGSNVLQSVLPPIDQAATSTPPVVTRTNIPFYQRVADQAGNVVDRSQAAGAVVRDAVGQVGRQVLDLIIPAVEGANVNRSIDASAESENLAENLNSYSDYYGLPPAYLYAVATQETNFGQNTNDSSAGAVGPLQILTSPDSAAGEVRFYRDLSTGEIDLRQGVNNRVTDDPLTPEQAARYELVSFDQLTPEQQHDPAFNVPAGASYANQAYVIEGGNIANAASYYNGGPSWRGLAARGGDAEGNRQYGTNVGNMYLAFTSALRQ